MPQHQRHQPLNWSGITFVNLSHRDDIRQRDIQNGIHRHVMAGVGRLRREKPRHVVITLEIMAPEANKGGFQPREPIASESEYINHPFHRIWVRMGFSDPTALYLSMGTTLLLWNRKNSIPTLKITDDMEPKRYYTKAPKDISARLSDPFDHKSAGVIATIIGCLCHDVSSIRFACISLFSPLEI
ncbi:unnamed protein product [Clonostachys rhizophaga]|uniref:Uncharacterized protein n=1 Tax=Clonostachys rhizophaga TaxID=160324 RepID=A0A9N9VYW8_9HYPO|nr:unnamed protein product [Clonostachys rhizophaga]